MPTRILYVEDEVYLGKIVAESLERRGYQVRWETDGSSVMDAAQAFSPAICLLDVMLPGVNGFDLGSRLRTQYPDLPIIFLTARDQTEDVLKGFSSGGNDYIRKPFSIEELIARIENLRSVMQKSTGTEEVLRMGGSSFTPASMELQTPGHTYRLSHREAELLKALVTRRNLPVERRAILKDLWGDDSFFNSRNLDVYITRLRKYLKDDQAVEIITLKGVGYQFLVRS